MFAEFVARILRFPWGGTPYLEGRSDGELTNAVLAQQQRHTASMVQKLAEEIATLVAKSPTLGAAVPTTIELQGENYNPPDRYVGDNDCGDSLHALSASNPSSRVVEDADGNLIVRNGYAFRACGVSEFKSADQRDFNNNDGETSLSFGLLCDNHFVTNLFQIANNAQIKFGDVIIWNGGNWTTNSSYNPDTYQVKLETSASTTAFLSRFMKDLSTATYDSSVDLLVKAVITGGQLRFFVDADDTFASFSASTSQAYGHGPSTGSKAYNFTTNCSTA